jgi:hypothetical protein
MIAELTAAGGVRAVVPKDKLNAFCNRVPLFPSYSVREVEQILTGPLRVPVSQALTLSPSVVSPILEEQLLTSDNAQVRLVCDSEHGFTFRPVI